MGAENRKKFEDAVFRKHFFVNVKFKEGKQFADVSGQLTQAELCERDGDGYKREDVGAMWFGYELAATLARAPDMEPLTPLQRKVADHYLDGEFSHVQNMSEARLVGDSLFVFCLNEAIHAEDDAETAEDAAGNLEDMLQRAAGSLTKLRYDVVEVPSPTLK